MIYEMRTYDLKPRSLPEVLKRWGEAIEKRTKLSPLAAFWYTEIGPLNQKAASGESFVLFSMASPQRLRTSGSERGFRS